MSRSIKRIFSGIAALSVAALVISGCSPAATDVAEEAEAEAEVEVEVAAFYEGKNIEIIVPYGPGGGVSVAAQLVAPYLTEETDGSPAIVINNVGGSGTIKGGNEYALQRDSDGLSTFFTATSNVLTWILGGDEVQFDLSSMKPIVAFPTGAVVYSNTSSGIASAEDLRDATSPVTLAAKTPTGSEIFALLAFEVLKISDNVRPIFGYEGGGDRRLAFERGEVAMDHGTSISYIGGGGQDLADEGKAALLFTHGLLNSEGVFVRDPALPDTPTVYELYVDWYGEEPSGDAWEAYKASRDIAGGFGFAILMHGDAPQEAIDQLRAGAERAVNNPQFLEDAPDAIGPYDAVAGADLLGLEQRLARTSEDEAIVESFDWLRGWISAEFSG